LFLHNFCLSLIYFNHINKSKYAKVDNFLAYEPLGNKMDYHTYAKFDFFLHNLRQKKLKK